MAAVLLCCLISVARVAGVELVLVVVVVVVYNRQLSYPTLPYATRTVSPRGLSSAERHLRDNSRWIEICGALILTKAEDQERGDFGSVGAPAL